jgi:hypothetical protein
MQDETLADFAPKFSNILAVSVPDENFPRN